MPERLILVIDDQEETREFIVDHVLSPNGYHFTLAIDGREGVHKAIAAKPDLIILNVETLDPVLKLLREQGIDVPVLLCTSRGLRDPLFRDSRLRNIEYVIEPFAASQTLMAIERALAESQLHQERERLQQRLERQIQEQRVFYSLSQALISLSDHQQVLNRIVEAAVYLTGADKGSLILKDSDSDTIRVRAHLDKGQSTNGVESTVQKERNGRYLQRANTVDRATQDRRVQHVLTSGEPLNLSGQDAARVKSQAVSPPASLYVPIKMRRQTIGVLHVARSVKSIDAPLPHAFTQVDIYGLSTLANYAAIAIEKDRLHSEIQNEMERTAISQIGASFGSTLRLDSILEMAMQVAVRILDADRGCIVLVDQETNTYTPHVTHALSLQTLDAPEFQPGKSLVHRAISERTPIRTVIEYHRERNGADNVARAVMCAPIVGASDALGAIYVDRQNQGKPFDRYQQDLLTALAVNAAAAVENAGLFGQVEAERRKLEAVIRGTVQPVIVTGVDGTVLLMNYAAHQVFSTQNSKATGMLLPQILNHPTLSSMCDQARISGRSQHGEIRLANTQIFNTTVTPISGVGYVTVMQDITEFERLSQMKSEFVATVSHDLRSPLSTVLSLLDVVKQAGPLNDHQQEFLTDAEQEVTRLLSLTRDLLDLGQLEADFDLETKECDLGKLVKMSLNSWQSQIAKRHHTLDVDLPAEPVWVHGNDMRLRQVIDNLISNAMKYTAEWGHIKVSLAQEGTNVVFQIQDSGIGIAPEDQPHVFDRFFRVRNKQTEDIEGTGLGLAIVKSIVERHNGRVWLESEPRRGSTFGVELPAARS